VHGSGQREKGRLGANMARLAGTTSMPHTPTGNVPPYNSPIMSPPDVGGLRIVTSTNQSTPQSGSALPLTSPLSVAKSISMDSTPIHALMSPSARKRPHHHLAGHHRSQSISLVPFSGKAIPGSHERTGEEPVPSDQALQRGASLPLVEEGTPLSLPRLASDIAHPLGQTSPLRSVTIHHGSSIHEMNPSPRLELTSCLRTTSNIGPTIAGRTMAAPITVRGGLYTPTPSPLITFHLAFATRRAPPRSTRRPSPAYRLGSHDQMTEEEHGEQEYTTFLDQLYRHVIRKLAFALQYEQLKCDYVRRESELMMAIREEPQSGGKYTECYIRS
jgi:hypothetical protein